MNYIEYIRGFWRSHEEHSFSPTEIALYFYLLEVCNICNWKNPFKRNNALIMADLGIKDRRTLDHARNKLKQAGLIDSQKKSTNPNVTYKLLPAFYAQGNAQGNAQAEAQAGEQANDTKDKQNQTNLFNDSSKPIVKFKPPALDEVRAYCEQRGNQVSPERFIDHYTANGWMRGKNKIKDWRAAVRTWENNSKSYSHERNTTGGAANQGTPNYGSL